MHDLDQSALDWRDGVPVSRRFGDPYYSLEDGAAETTHVFLDGNDLPARFRSGFHIAELGFGTGLNALVAWRAWRQAGLSGPLRFTSFEAYPLGRTEMEQALAAFPALSPEAEELLAKWSGPGCLTLDGLTLEVIAGDARTTLPRWDGSADAWFLDGFAPARNPELWSDALMAEVAGRTAPGGTASSYTAAGHVRRALDAAGFDVDRVPGYGRKRHMIRAHRR
ncbi:tRNA U34 5-methylaminomethyl-2-thiouridine-forming methyltransferase MnmC [Palleronia aestuarii]|uniref:tRNA U34 5-methylaminomethyl-2-thiouridine-forming methyltransferase MnmC n=1 Tax=Palleronia aestuarii TaxID=568105 RepID=A0A2W7N990_9RHOB|nr:tRNA (5-methylaminomethyl-2-thiouridine)(34)-methyltransferase MnmD [Palleronia aestuarii]PZX16600.1 tRNA U34 5-methylaminomethyl-2-thiouridine-forming methyltransferase MnmC [Palleronia aestuarii]